MTQCILLVDDEPTILQVAKRILEAERFVVLTAKDGLDALTVLEARRVDALLTDLRMPGMSGHELILEARRRYPRLRVCCMTGYVEETGVEDVHLMRKPFQTHELIWTMKRVMARAKVQANGRSR
jgi:CheY-like chemotaxis protein